MFKKLIGNILGSKANRDLKAINPILEQTLKAYESIKVLSNDELRAKTLEFKKRIADHIQDEADKIDEIKSAIDGDSDMDIDQKEKYYEEIDKLEKAAIKKHRKSLI